MPINILVVDDNPINRIIIKKMITMITDDTVVIEESKNGKHALEAIHDKGSLPQFIILDINMPEMGGDEFVGRLSEIYDTKALEKTSIFISSASVIDDLKSQLNQYPYVKGYLNKPFTAEQLSELILPNS